MRAFIGLGSNLDGPKQHILRAIKDLQHCEDLVVTASSSLYASPPMGPQDQPDYVNAVVEVDTDLTAHELLDLLQQLEQQHGRQRKRHWGERTLDLDILLFDEQQINDDRLVVPHPGLAERAFVVYPLAEIASGLIIPGMGKLEDILAACPRAGLQQQESVRL
jgi:2-amino-4-hydroxy-6-hydroxymethyldihydropteridine diphosphokinase